MCDEEETFDKSDKRMDDLRRSKARTGTRLKRTRNRLQDAISHNDSDMVRNHRDDIVNHEEELREILENLIDLHRSKQETDRATAIIDELERIDEENQVLLGAANHFLLASEQRSSETDSVNRFDASKKNDAPKVNDIGRDMWTQLQRVQIPLFTGDKKTFESWKAAFDACVDQAPATAEYKLLQLRQSLRGEALRAIDGLGYSAEAYEAAKRRLIQKYGGERRVLKRYLDELRQFRPIKSESVKELEKFADLLDIATINMKSCGLEGELGLGMTYTICLSKLNEKLATSYHEWVAANRHSESVETLHTWVQRQVEFRSMAMEDVNGLQTNSPERGDSICREKCPERSQRNSFSRSYFQKTKENLCLVCSGNHPIWKCDSFKSMSVEDRRTITKGNRLCWLCLLRGHQVKRCRWTRPCGHDGCLKMHNRLLHAEEFDSSQEQSDLLPHSSMEKEPTVRREALEVATPPMTHHVRGSAHISFRTVPAIVKGRSKQLKVLVLLDDASNTSYINEDVASELGLDGPGKDVTVNVVNGQMESFFSREVSFVISSIDGRYKHQVTALTAKKVVGKLKGVNWHKEKHQWDHIRHVPFPFVDPQKSVDILLGADCIDLHTCLKEVNGCAGDPIARLTPLGWTCVGRTKSNRPSPHNEAYCTYQCATAIEDNTDDLIRKFWEIEDEGPRSTKFTSAEQSAIDDATQSLKHCGDRYEISIPWEKDKPNLPSSDVMALQRLKTTERKLIKDHIIAETYKSTIDSYVQKGYVTKLSACEIESEPARWLLPHFPIVRLDKSTTKVRIVFDASAKVSGVSLNDVINPGPKLQRDLFTVLLRFRKYSIALVCDIEQMYLQIQIAERDRPYFRFLWRDLEPDKQPDQYQFNRLVFGVNTCPFLAQFVTQQHAQKVQHERPRAAETVLESTYMDDCMDSTPTTAEAIQLYKDLSELWESAGMKARKWLSNSKEVLSEIPIQDRAAEVDICSHELPQQKALGVLWQASKDQFTFTSRKLSPEIMTKRHLLRIIATLFDPLGFLAPVIVRGRFLLQQLWTEGLQWDDCFPPHLLHTVSEWLNDLEALNEVTLQRSLHVRDETELHIFNDASEKAYGAVAYVRNGSCEDFETRLVAAKVKVAPLTAISISRLELMAAIIGLRLADKVCQSLNIDLHRVFFWSDSMNVLFWIRQQSRNFKPFVANRVGEIQRFTSPAQWKHVPGHLNPADLLSRGLTTQELTKSTLWWNGPEFLQCLETQWPKSELTPVICKDDKKEMKSKQLSLSCCVTQEIQIGLVPQTNPKKNTNSVPQEIPIEERYSSWMKLRRVIGWILRFVSNCRTQRGIRQFGELTVDELQDADMNIIRNTQRVVFDKEYQQLSKNKTLPQKSSLVALTPVLDTDNVMRVDGRLKNAEFLSYNARHPIILPKDGAVTRLIVKHYHESCQHSGTNRTFVELSQKFWIISGREVIRSWEKECTWCRRKKSRLKTPIMAPLPACRLTQSFRAFYHISIDFGGPFLTKQGRGKSRAKRYLCLFTCFSTRAVHLEMTFGLDTDSFLNAFFRMVSRRGLPEKVYSDNGTNFKAAEAELRELVKKLDQSRIGKVLANKGIRWYFQPPYGPHFGGAHESLIKSAKRAVNAILGNADVNDEELASVIVGAEGLLNSRPLTYQTANHLDPEPLTPNHFLHGMNGGQFAPESVDTTEFPLHRRWRRVQELTRHVWRRWLREYVPTLQPRRKWTQDHQKDLVVGDVVLVIDPNSARGQWPLGRITEVFPGTDGHVRVVRVQVAGQTFIRPVSKLSFLTPSYPS